MDRSRDCSRRHCASVTLAISLRPRMGKPCAAFNGALTGGVEESARRRGHEILARRWHSPQFPRCAESDGAGRSRRRALPLRTGERAAQSPWDDAVAIASPVRGARILGTAISRRAGSRWTLLQARRLGNDQIPSTRPVESPRRATPPTPIRSSMLKIQVAHRLGLELDMPPGGEAAAAAAGQDDRAGWSGCGGCRRRCRCRRRSSNCEAANCHRRL